MNTALLRDRQCDAHVEVIPESLATGFFKQIHEDWRLDEDGDSLIRDFKFSNYYETIAFVNAIAWIANTQDHHPDMLIGYNRCRMTWTTHSVHGLSENDFICAARCDAL